MNPITALVIDDEVLSREGLALRLDSIEDIHVVGQCADGKQALEAIAVHKPQVIFLDIEMPELNGLELANQLSEQGALCPQIVYVTAFKEFALQAIERQAVDYLLKPYSEERLLCCIEKLRLLRDKQQAFEQQHQLEELLSRKTGHSLQGFMQNLQQSCHQSEVLQHIISLKSGTEWIRIRPDQINWIEAAGDYMCVHTTQGTHIIRKTLKQFETELGQHKFLRVNRSAIVNLGKVTRLSPNSNGEYLATLQSGEQIKVSRKYKFKLDELRAN